MALARLDGVFTAANPTLQRMLGRANEEIVGHSFLELNLEEERAATAEALTKFRCVDSKTTTTAPQNCAIGFGSLRGI